MTEPRYLNIVAHYEDCLAVHGSGPEAVNWNSPAAARTRYDVMLGVIRELHKPASLLDFGCGLGDLKDHMAARGLDQIAYTGLDISPKFVVAAEKAHPDTPFLCLDVLEADSVLPEFDYVVMNGVFTRRHDLSEAEMADYLRTLVAKVAASCRIGMAFNVMSSQVDWKNEALFHPSLDLVADVVAGAMSRHFVLRNDYGLYETTCYAYREAVAGVSDA